MRFLADHGHLVGRVLDYGCGKGFDADFYGTEKYDPHFHPELPTGKFDTITCNYVLNVIQEPEQRKVMKHIHNLLTPTGRAFFAVRRDIPMDGVTKRGTYQRTVYMKGSGVRLLVENSGFAIYERVW